MSGWNRPDENTLGVILGRRRRTGVPAESTAARAVVHANAQGASLGTSHLGIGAGVLCAIQAVYGLAVFATNLGSYPALAPIVAAWGLFVVAFAAVSLTIATRGERFPGWMFGVACACCPVMTHSTTFIPRFRLDLFSSTRVALSA